MIKDTHEWGWKVPLNYWFNGTAVSLLAPRNKSDIGIFCAIVKLVNALPYIVGSGPTWNSDPSHWCQTSTNLPSSDRPFLLLAQMIWCHKSKHPISWPIDTIRGMVCGWDVSEEIPITMELVNWGKTLIRPSVTGKWGETITGQVKTHSICQTVYVALYWLVHLSLTWLILKSNSV